MADVDGVWFRCPTGFLTLCCPSSLITKPVEMDMSKLPKIRDEERESQFGYVHGVSGPGSPSHLLKITLTRSVICQQRQEIKA